MIRFFLVSATNAVLENKKTKMYRPVHFDICGVLPTARSDSTVTVVHIIITVEQRYDVHLLGSFEGDEKKVDRLLPAGNPFFIIIMIALAYNHHSTDEDSARFSNT